LAALTGVHKQQHIVIRRLIASRTPHCFCWINNRNWLLLLLLPMLLLAACCD
jgi:hypothetical protein